MDFTRRTITTTERAKLLSILKASHSLQRRLYDMQEYFEHKNLKASGLCGEAAFEIDVTYEKIKEVIELPCTRNQRHA